MVLLIDWTIAGFDRVGLSSVIFLIYMALGILTVIPIVAPHIRIEKIALIVVVGFAGTIFYFLWILGCGMGNCLPLVYSRYFYHLVGPDPSQVLLSFTVYVVTLIIIAVISGFLFLASWTLKEVRKPAVSAVTCILLPFVALYFSEPIGLGFFSIVYSWVFRKISSAVLIVVQLIVISSCLALFVEFSTFERFSGTIHFSDTWLFAIPVIAGIVIAVSRIPVSGNDKGPEFVIFLTSVVSAFILSIVYWAPGGSIGTIFEGVVLQGNGSWVNGMIQLVILGMISTFVVLAVYFAIQSVLRKINWQFSPASERDQGGVGSPSDMASGELENRP